MIPSLSAASRYAFFKNKAPALYRILQAWTLAFISSHIIITQ